MNFQHSISPSARRSIGLLSIAILLAAGTQATAAEAPASPAAVYANALLDGIFTHEEHRFGREEEPSHDAEGRALIALGHAGWDETYKRLASGHFDSAFVAVLATRSYWDGEAERTQRLMRLLAMKEFNRRSWIPQIIAAKEPLKANQLLLSYLTDSDPDVRTACITALSPAMAAPPEIESVIGLLDDPSESVRFQGRVFLERATGHIPEGDAASSGSKAAWSKWWHDQKPVGMATIVKAELTRCASLLTHPDEALRERAGRALVAHSGQPYYGFHQNNPWWGVHHGERSKECWLEWLRLRYSGKEHVKSTGWEDEFHIQHPEVPLDVLRATISMNVNDLDSEHSLVRSSARGSIAALLGEVSPFRESRSDPEGDWLNVGIQHWWKQRLKALQE